VGLISDALTAVDALHLEDFNLLLEKVGEVDGVHEQILELLLPLRLLVVSILQVLQFVPAFGGVLRLEGPLLVFLGRFLEVFIDSVELLEGNLFLELVEVEDPHLDDTLSALVGAVSSAILAFLVEGVDLAHFGEHGVLLVNFVLFYIFVKFFFPDLLALLEAQQVLD
jgi:hypothetical protein